MKLKALTFSFLLTIFSTAVMAGSGHDHGHSPSRPPVSQEIAKENAKKAVVGLVQNNHLDQSWVSITASFIEQKMFGGVPEWKVVFVNDKVTDTKKRTLYVFLTLSGDYVGANHTGN